MKDYYKILETSRQSSEADIKKAYRHLALKYHPDRNPGDKQAENRFKEIAEAYSILGDPDKRRQYDAGGFTGYTGRGDDFSDAVDEVLKNFFRDPRQRAFFDELRRDFEQQGFRFDEKFFNNIFFRGSGIVFGGIFTMGPRGTGFRPFGKKGGDIYEERRETVENRPLSLGGIMGKIGEKVGGLINRWLGSGTSAISHERAESPKDLHYRIGISREEALRGTKVVVSYPRGEIREKIMVRVPAGVKNGTKLKLKDMGLPTKDGKPSGNLYLQINIH